MQRRTRSYAPFITGGLVALGFLALAESSPAQEPVTSRLKLAIGGYIKPEFIYHDKRLGGVTGGISGAFSAVPQHNTVAGDNGSFKADTVESRLNFTLTAPDWRGIKPTGFFEFDFFGDSSSAFRAGANGATAGTSATNADNSIFNGTPRIRHAYLQLAGEGLGGQWRILVGQTWALFGLQPYSFGSSVSFGGGSVLFDRPTQLRATHIWKPFRDIEFETAASLSRAAAQFGEVPDATIAERVAWTGWQGWQGGSRAPLSFGVSGVVGRVKADLFSNTTVNNGTRSLSNTRWGVAGYATVPILPGRSATDRTWALTVQAEGSYGEGIADYIVGVNPVVSIAALTLSETNVAGVQQGQAFFNPGSCSAGGPAVPGAALTAPAAAACGAVGTPTELSLFRSVQTHVQGQFYLPWNLWVVGGWKFINFTNADNAVARTSLGGTGAVITPANQGGVDGVLTQAALFGGRDALIKRQWAAFGVLFWDMTPNVRWGFEYAHMATNRRNADQDNGDNRFQLAAYFFF